MYSSSPSTRDIIKIFFVYAQKDKKLRQELEKHLSALKSSGVVMNWYQHQLEEEQSGNNENSQQMNKADVIALLVSPDFISLVQNDVRWKTIINQALRNEEQRVIPILLRQCYGWESVLGNLAPLPRNGLAVTSWSNRDEAFAQQVAPGIQEIVEELKQYQRNLYEYSQKIYTIFQPEFPHISSKTRNYFSKIKQDLGLKDKDVELIHKEITARLDKEYNQRLKQYRQGFRQFIQSDEPISEPDRKKLKDLQQQLALKDEEVAKIEQEITQEIANQPIRQIKRYVNQFPQSIAIAVGSLALATFLGFGSSYPPDTQAKNLFAQGQNKIEQGDYRGAIEDYNQAITADSKYVDAYNKRGNAHYYLKNYKAALDDYTQVIRLAPDWADAYEHRAVVRAALKDKQGAIKDYQKALALYKKQGATGAYKRTLNRLKQLQSSKR